MITEIRTSVKPAAKRKRGFTLTEIAIVLGIIGLILGAIWAAASSVYANLKANQAQQGILAAAQAVRSLYATSANTGIASGTNTAITSPGMFPVNWQSTTTGVTGNPWHVNPPVNYAWVIGNGQTFAVEIDGISDAGCATLSGFYSLAASSSAGGQVPGLVGSNFSIAAAGGTGTPALNATQGTAPATAANFKASPGACLGGTLKDAIAITFDMSIM